MNSILRRALLLCLVVSPFMLAANSSENHDDLSSAEDVLAQYDLTNEQQSAENQIEQVKHKLDDEEREMLDNALSEQDVDLSEELLSE